MCASLGDGSASFCGASYFIPQPQDAEYIKQFQTIWLNLRCTHNRDWISLPAKGALRLHRGWPEEKVTKSDFREKLWLDLKIYCYTPTTNLNAPSLPQCDASSFQTGCLWRQWGAISSVRQWASVVLLERRVRKVRPLEKLWGFYSLNLQVTPTCAAWVTSENALFSWRFSVALT